MVKERWWSDASWQSYCSSELKQSADNQQFLLTLHCNSSVGMHWMIVLGQFSISIHLPVGLCKLRFNWASSILPNLSHIISRGLRAVGLRFRGLYFGSYQDLACLIWIFWLQMWYSFRQTTITFSKEGATKIKSKQFSEFGSRTTSRDV